MPIFVIATIGDRYERSTEIKEFGNIREAEDWINEEIAKNRSPEEVIVEAVIEGTKLRAIPVQYVTRMEIRR